MKNKLSKIAIVLTIIVFVLGCQKQEIKLELTPVNVQLKWLHQAQFAGNYVAHEKGFYAKNGIKIEKFIPFDFTNLPIEAVQNKEVEFGITGGDELIQARAKGKAQDVKAVAVIYKINPVCLYSLKESGITKPEDLIGKTVGIERAADGTEINIGILYQAMLGKLGINKSQINDITIGYDATELLAGETDVSTGYVINEPHQAIEAGHEVNIILPAEYGVNMYADVIIVHEDIIVNNPELVRSFVKSTLDGWQFAIENEAETVDIVLKYTTDRTKSHETYMLQQSIPLIHTGDSKIGLMNTEMWNKMVDILIDNEVISSRVDVNSIFTNEFIE